MAEGRDSSRGESGVHERLVARRQADALVGDAEATRDLLVVHARGSVGDAHGEGAVAAQDDALHDVVDGDSQRVGAGLDVRGVRRAPHELHVRCVVGGDPRAKVFRRHRLPPGGFEGR